MQYDVVCETFGNELVKLPESHMVTPKFQDILRDLNKDMNLRLLMQKKKIAFQT